MKIVLHGEIVWHDSEMANRFNKTAKACKSRKSFVLSADVLDLLEKEKTRRGSESVAITKYYDSLSDEEQEEDRRWGEFAESQFSTE